MEVSNDQQDFPSKNLQRRPSYGDAVSMSKSSPQLKWDLLRRRVKLNTTPAHGVGNAHTGMRSILKRGISKTSIAGSENREQQEKPQYQNTYQLVPNKPFNVSQVTEAIQDILEALLREQEYDVTRISKMTKRITEAVKTRVKSMRFTRYKIVVHTVMGSKMNQGIEIGSRGLWNQDTDSSASYFYENRELFAVVTVYGIYYE